jgi:hypothetical protein
VRPTAALAGVVAALAGAPAAAATGSAGSGGPAAVGAVWLQEGFACSGVLIAPDQVVTAGHCVDHLIPDDPGAEVRFATGSAPVQRVTLHPDHFAAAEADLAVLWLATSSPTEPLSPRMAPPDEDWDLWALEVAGWGVSEPDGDDGGVALRSFDALVEEVTDASIWFDGVDAFVCDGDSGGAVLRVDGEDVELVGLVLGGEPDCDGPGEALLLPAFTAFLTDPDGTLEGDRPFGGDDDDAPPVGGLGLPPGSSPGPAATGCAGAAAEIAPGRGRAAGLVLGLVVWLRRRPRGACQEQAISNKSAARPTCC